MNVESLNEYVLHYLKEDKTNSAIMLSGSWGIGKSHYVKNDLITCLEGNGFKCVVISVNGLNTIDEVSNVIYCGLLASHFHMDSSDKKTQAGFAFAKTIAQNLIKNVGFDLTVEGNNVKEMFKLVDLTQKLIVIEDLERSELEFAQILGFVNNMTEQDGAKILLVANEDEIIKKERLSENEEEYTESTKKYLRTKEKTISDTILFECDLEQAIRKIMNKFSFPKLMEVGDPKIVLSIMKEIKCYNLRSFVFACQKTVDILKKVTDSVNDDVYRCIFYSITAYSLKLKMGEGKLYWDGSEKYSFPLGTKDYPLFRFCYDYIRNHELVISAVYEANGLLERIKLYDQTANTDDPYIKILSEYWLYYDNKVREAIEVVTEGLKSDHRKYSFYVYDNLAAYLISIKHDLGIDISEAEKYLIENLKKCEEDIDLDALFQVTLRGMGAEKEKDFTELIRNMRMAIGKDKYSHAFLFNYDSAQLAEFHDYVVKNKKLYIAQESFIYSFDIEKLAEMFSTSSPREMDVLRRIFRTIYGVERAKSIFQRDLSALIELRERINDYRVSGRGDRTQHLQAEMFYDNLSEYINAMKPVVGT